jgi:hypothetical protein
MELTFAQRLTRRYLRNLSWLRPFVSIETYQALRYRVWYGERLPLDHPVTFTQRLFVKMARDRDPLLPLTADKVTMRDYVERRLGPGHLAEVHAVLDSPEALRDATLPARYVVKATRGSSMQAFVEQDSPARRAEVVAQARRWFRKRHGERHGEWAYLGLRQRLLVEEWLDDGEHAVPLDWKWFCFHGEVGIVQLDGDRFTAHWRNLYAPDGTPLDATRHYRAGPPLPAPASFGAMRRIAERLSGEFDFIRVDLYALRDRIVVGELTHYPDTGRQLFRPQEWESRLGELWARRAQSHHP